MVDVLGQRACLLSGIPVLVDKGARRARLRNGKKWDLNLPKTARLGELISGRLCSHGHHNYQSERRRL